jgi:hypothetical protein
MKKPEGMTKTEVGNADDASRWARKLSSFGFRHYFVIRHSSLGFGIFQPAA